MLLKEIQGKVVHVAWSPVKGFGNYMATGTKEGGGVGFDSTGGELELHRFDFGTSSDLATVALAAIKTE